MCELTVVLNGKKVFNECVYAKQKNNNVTVRNLSGFPRGFLNVAIAEVDIGKETLTLKSVKCQPRSLLDQIKPLSRISQILREHPKGLTIKEVSKEVKINRNPVAKYLEIMLELGLVEMRPVGIAKMYFATE